jgi:hypothetical protein
MRERIADDRGRLRSNVRMFIGAREVRELAEAVCPGETVHVICALSGG